MNVSNIAAELALEHFNLNKQHVVKETSFISWFGIKLFFRSSVRHVPTFQVNESISCFFFRRDWIKKIQETKSNWKMPNRWEQD